MAQEIQLKGLPVPIKDGQVFYLENTENKKLNSFIRKNHEWLKEIFKKEHLQFIYLPIWLNEVIKYNAPQVDSKKREELVGKLARLEDCIDDIPSPTILAFATTAKDAELKSLAYIEIETKWYRSTKTVFEHLAKEIRSEMRMAKEREEAEKVALLKEELDKKVLHRGQFAFVEDKEPKQTVRHSIDLSGDLGDEGDIRFCKRRDIQYSRKAEEPVSLSTPKPPKEEMRYSRRDRSGDGDVLYSITAPRHDADEQFEKESQKLMKEVRERVDALKSMGFDLSFLHNMIDEGEKLSRLVITKDKRILLPDYDNMEIHLSELPKAVFLLFLRHKEGIRFKELPDYRDELLEIYLSLNPRGSKEKNERSICDITDPLKNSINEKCARIREAFVKEFDDRLARHYYISGKQGEAKRIELDANLIEWEDPLNPPA